MKDNLETLGTYDHRGDHSGVVFAVAAVANGPDRHSFFGVFVSNGRDLKWRFHRMISFDISQ